MRGGGGEGEKKCNLSRTTIGCKKQAYGTVLKIWIIFNLGITINTPNEEELLAQCTSKYSEWEQGEWPASCFGTH